MTPVDYELHTIKVTPVWEQVHASAVIAHSKKVMLKILED